MGCKHTKGQSCLAGCVQESHPTAPHHPPLAYTRYAKAFRGFYSSSLTPILSKIFKHGKRGGVGLPANRSPAQANPMKSTSSTSGVTAQRQTNVLGKGCWSHAESGTSTHFPPLLQEQGRTDPNSSGQLPAGQKDGVTLPKAPTKAEGSAAHPKPEDGLLEVLVPSWA